MTTTNKDSNGRTARTWLKATIKTPEVVVDAAAAFLTELTGSGVQFITDNDAREPSKTVAIVGYLAADDLLPGKTEELKAFISRLQREQLSNLNAITISYEPVEEEDWNQQWKKHFKPLRITSRLLIRPSWEKAPEAEKGLLIMELDPGLAFGTGHHASTRLALELLEDAAYADRPAPPTVLDVGTGTGILAMACALYGAQKVVAVDNDHDAVLAALENIRTNRLEKVISACGTPLPEISERYDLVAANITADVLCGCAPELTARLAPRGTLVLSGILAGEQENQVRAAYENLGLNLHDRRQHDEWVALAWQRRKETS